MAFDTMTQLGQMQKVPLDMTLDGLAALRQTQQADNIGLQELMRRQSYEQQMDPLRVAEQGLRNKGLILDQQKTDYELKSLGRKNRMETELWDQSKATALAKLLDEQGEAKANVFGQELYQRLQKTQPGTREYKTIVGALQTTKGWMEKKRDAGYAEAAQNRLFAQQTELEEKRIAGRLAAATAAGNLKKSLQQGVDPKKIVGELTQRILKETDPEMKRLLQDQLEFATAIAERFQVVPPLQIDPAAVGGVLQESRGAVPKAPGIQPKIVESYTLDQLKKIYPGVDETTIREAAKANNITIK